MALAWQQGPFGEHPAGRFLLEGTLRATSSTLNQQAGGCALNSAEPSSRKVTT
jgi:hypothetical protein